MHIFTTAEILEIEEKQPRCLALDRVLNTDALKASVCQVTGATECIELSKLAEGGFNRVFVARMNNTMEVVARVAYENERWEGSGKMESEVATIQWLARNTDIPVPKVLFSCSDPNNPVGAAYMVMERVPGRTLSRLWRTLEETQKDQIVAKLAQFTATLVKSSHFDKIGSLYANRDAISVGPLVPPFNPFFFRKDLSLDRGPWPSEREYLLASVRREIEWISNSANQDELAAEWNGDGAGRSKEELVTGYTSVLRKVEKHITSMKGLDVRYEGIGPFVLRHIDLNPMNIIVREDDPTVITGVIDWEGANVVPLWVVAQVPEFLHDSGDENEPDPVDRASRARLRDLFTKTASGALPGVFDAASEARFGGSLGKVEKVAQSISTALSLEWVESVAASILGNN